MILQKICPWFISFFFSMKVVSIKRKRNDDYKRYSQLETKLNVEIGTLDWNANIHGRTNVAPSKGSWTVSINIPLHLWSLSTFRAIGNLFGGFIDSPDCNLAVIDCMKAANLQLK